MLRFPLSPTVFYSEEQIALSHAQLFRYSRVLLMQRTEIFNPKMPTKSAYRIGGTDLSCLLIAPVLIGRRSG